MLADDWTPRVSLRDGQLIAHGSFAAIHCSILQAERHPEGPRCCRRYFLHPGGTRNGPPIDTVPLGFVKLPCSLVDAWIDGSGDSVRRAGRSAAGNGRLGHGRRERQHQGWPQRQFQTGRTPRQRTHTGDSPRRFLGRCTVPEPASLESAATPAVATTRSATSSMALRRDETRIRGASGSNMSFTATSRHATACSCLPTSASALTRARGRHRTTGSASGNGSRLWYDVIVGWRFSPGAPEGFAHLWIKTSGEERYRRFGWKDVSVGYTEQPYLADLEQEDRHLPRCVGAARQAACRRGALRQRLEPGEPRSIRQPMNDNGVHRVSTVRPANVSRSRCAIVAASQMGMASLANAASYEFRAAPADNPPARPGALQRQRLEEQLSPTAWSSVTSSSLTYSRAGNRPASSSTGPGSTTFWRARASGATRESSDATPNTRTGNPNRFVADLPSPRACAASAAGLIAAQAAFAAQCPAQQRDDSDPNDGGWICANYRIGAASSIGRITRTQRHDSVIHRFDAGLSTPVHRVIPRFIPEAVM